MGVGSLCLRFFAFFLDEFPFPGIGLSFDCVCWGSGVSFKSIRTLWSVDWVSIWVVEAVGGVEWSPETFCTCGSMFLSWWPKTVVVNLFVVRTCYCVLPSSCLSDY